MLGGGGGGGLSESDQGLFVNFYNRISCKSLDNQLEDSIFHYQALYN